MPEAATHEVFTSYAHEDRPLCGELDNHLALLRHKGVIRTWYDRDITAGDSWRDRIDEHLESADLILLLVSADFFASAYCYDVEMKRALERRNAGQARVIPIVARSVDVEDAPFGEVQWLPTGGKAVTSWANRDEAWTDVVKGIRRSIAELEASPAWAVHRTRAGPERVDPGTTAAVANRVEIVLDGFRSSVEEASRRRGIAAASPDEIHRVGGELAGMVEMKRILWVDDVPANNAIEIAALARLQIEVRTCVSTGQALEALASDPEPFHLVISDWSRPAEGSGLPAGMRLARALRKRRIATPLIFYYGVLSKTLELARHAVAIAAGARAATCVPGDLLKAIQQALR